MLSKYLSHSTGVRKRGAFTLIELLVVIAIIAILAAILFPVFAQARDKARTIACLSNQKQLGLALLQYVQDYDEYVPCNPNNGMRGFGGKLYPYYKSADILACPNDLSPMPPNKYLRVSYAGNNNMGTINGAGNNAQPLINNIVNPAKSIVFCEIVDSGQTTVTLASLQNATEDTPSSDGYGKPQPNYATTAYPAGACLNDIGAVGGRPFIVGGWTRAIVGRHQQGSNYVFFDGHAKWLPPAQVSAGRTQKISACNQDNSPVVAGCANNTATSFFAAGTNGNANGQPVAATFGIY